MSKLRAIENYIPRAVLEEQLNDASKRAAEFALSLSRANEITAELEAERDDLRAELAEWELDLARVKAERDEYARAMLWAHGYSVPGWPSFFDHCGIKSGVRYEWRSVIRKRLQEAGIDIEDCFRALVAEKEGRDEEGAEEAR